MNFNTTIVYDKALLAYRILLIHHKTGFALSGKIFDYVKNAVDLEVLNRLEAMLESKLGKPAAAAVMAEYEAICHGKTYREYLARTRGRQAG
jgi:hypothetical protein